MLAGAAGPQWSALEARHATEATARTKSLEGWLSARRQHDQTATAAARTQLLADQDRLTATRGEAVALIKATDPRGFSTGYTYDGLDRLRAQQDPGKDRPYQTVYDEVGQLTKTIDPLKDTHSYTYFSVTGRTATEVDANGNTTSYTYTKAGRQASITNPAGAKTTYGYDNRGNLSTVVSPRGNVKGGNPANFTTTYTYDFNSNRVRVTHPYPGGGFVSQDTRFDELSRAVTNIDAFGKQTSTNYDNNSNVVSTVDPLGQKTSKVS